MMMKSVNVPPVSTPILKVDLRDILDEFGEDGSDVLNCPHRVALPGKCLKIGAHHLKTMNGDFADPGKILVRRWLRGDILDPADDTLPLRAVGANLKGGSFAGVDAYLNTGPPA